MNSEFDDLADLMVDQKYEVRKQALMIILQVSSTAEDRDKFTNTSLVKNAIKLLGDVECQQSVLSIMIQFAQDEKFANQFITLKAITRLSQDINERMFSYLKSKQIIDEPTALYVKLCLLALNNLTQVEEAKVEFLQLNEQEQCFYFRLFCNYFVNPKCDFFDGFKQILLNVTSSGDVRQRLLDKKLNMLAFFTKLLQTGELFAISVLKNMLFEYESIVQEIKDNNIINAVIEFMAKDIVQNHSIVKEDEQELMKQLAVFEVPATDSKEFLHRSAEALKCLLILTNSNENYDVNKARLDLVLRQLRKTPVDVDALNVVETVYVMAQ